MMREFQRCRWVGSRRFAQSFVVASPRVARPRATAHAHGIDYIVSRYRIVCAVEACFEHSVRNSGLIQGLGVWGALKRHPAPTEGHPAVCMMALPLCGAIRLSWPD